MQSVSNIANLNKYEVVVDKVTVIENNVSNLQGDLFVDGSNLLVGGDWLANYSNPTQEGTAVGFQAMQNTTTGQFPTGIGVGALGSQTTGANNTAVGYCYRNSVNGKIC